MILSKKQIKLPCRFRGKPSTLTVRQGMVDLLFTAGRMQRFDAISNIEPKDTGVSFHGLHFGDLFKKVEISHAQAAFIAKSFKIRKRVGRWSNGTLYLDRCVTDLKIASLGKPIYDIVIMKRGANARKQLARKYA